MRYIYRLHDSYKVQFLLKLSEQMLFFEDAVCAAAELNIITLMKSI